MDITVGIVNVPRHVSPFSPNKSYDSKDDADQANIKLMRTTAISMCLRADKPNRYSKAGSAESAARKAMAYIQAAIDRGLITFADNDAFISVAADVGYELPEPIGEEVIANDETDGGPSDDDPEFAVADD